MDSKSYPVGNRHDPAPQDPDKEWAILVIDDEQDVHAITRLALKKKTWRRRSFSLSHAYSGAEAKEILTQRSSEFQVAIIDVVMETDDAGLKLASWIRAFCPNSLRIILRTGQAGIAPEYYVLNEYDIDYYVAKAELDAERLYRVVVSALRSSQDIATLISFGAQLKKFTSVLQRVASIDDLILFMNEGLEFLGLKYHGKITFFHDLAARADNDTRARADTLLALHKAGYGLMKPIPHKEHALGETTAVMLFDVKPDSMDDGSTVPDVLGAVCMDFGGADSMTGTALDGLVRDLSLFVENWRTAYGTLRLQQQVSQERMLRERMYHERMQMIANMVTGVAHEINTPLGVANTANSMIAGLAADLVERLKTDKPAGDLVSDLEEATHLMGKNLHKAHTLIKAFKQLSSSQLSDERSITSVDAVISDCVETLQPETRKRRLQVEIKSPPSEQLTWNGYAGHLGQVAVNVIQNVMRYAYPAGGGRLEIRIEPVAHNGAPFYRIEFQDWGAGIEPGILPRIFDAFVTTGRATGGTGLGLAISRNIVHELLRGTFSCQSTMGEGSTFTVQVPKDVPSTTRSTRPPIALSTA